MVKTITAQRSPHVSRDATPFSAREKAKAKPKEAIAVKKKGQRGDGARCHPSRHPLRHGYKSSFSAIWHQSGRFTPRMDWMQKNSKGYAESWCGYKLHLDVIDGDIQISAILTSPVCMTAKPRSRWLK